MTPEIRNPNYRWLNELHTIITDKAIEASQTKNRIPIQMPTGTGKSYVISRICDTIPNFTRIEVIQPSYEILNQNQSRISRISRRHKIDLKTYAKFLADMKGLMKFSNIRRHLPSHYIIDEYQHANNETGIVGREVFKYLIELGIKFFFLSASPWDKEVIELWGQPIKALTYELAVKNEIVSNLKITNDMEKFIGKKCIVYLNNYDDFPEISKKLNHPTCYFVTGNDVDSYRSELRAWERSKTGVLIAMRRVAEGYSPPSDFYGVILPTCKLASRAMQMSGRASRIATKESYVYCPMDTISVMREAEYNTRGKFKWEVSS